MENRYILGTGTYDNKIFSICVFDREINSFIVSESVVGEKEFKKRKVELLEHYNAIKADGTEVPKYKSSKLTGIPHISKAISNYIIADKVIIDKILRKE